MIKSVATIVINKSPGEVFRFVAHVENFPLEQLLAKKAQQESQAALEQLKKLLEHWNE
jgi:hypothetical protein